jgi:hypothetical protein
MNAYNGIWRTFDRYGTVDRAWIAENGFASLLGMLVGLM